MQQVDWTRHLNMLSQERQKDAFPEFLKWLDAEGEVWAAMESKGAATVVAKINAKPNATLYTTDRNTAAGNCFRCNKPGHFVVNCPEGNSGERRGSFGARRGRKPPQNRLFNCAYCRDDN